MGNFRKFASKHWFVFAAAALIWACISISKAAPADPTAVGIAVIACLTVLLPMLYLACYPQTPKVRKIVRATLLAFSGLWVAGHLIPCSATLLQDHMEWISYMKWPIVIYVEIQTLAIVWRAVFQKKNSADELMDELVAAQGLPAWVATIGKMEVAFWKALWGCGARAGRYCSAILQTRKS